MPGVLIETAFITNPKRRVPSEQQTISAGPGKRNHRRDRILPYGGKKSGEGGRAIMSQQDSQEILPGTVLEFFEAKEIICGVCLASKNQRLNVLTQQNREINLAASRLIHSGSQPLNVQLTRDELVRSLNSIAALRRNLMAAVNVEELWSLIEGEDERVSARAYWLSLSSPRPSPTIMWQRCSGCCCRNASSFSSRTVRSIANSQEKIEQRRLEIEREKAKEISLKRAPNGCRPSGAIKAALPSQGLKKSSSRISRAFACTARKPPVFSLCEGTPDKS